VENKKTPQNQGKRPDKTQTDAQEETSYTSNSVTEIMEVVDSLP